LFQKKASLLSEKEGWPGREARADGPLQSFSNEQADVEASLFQRPPLMLSASPSEFLGIVGIASLVPQSPPALGCYTVLQGIPDNSLRSSGHAEPLLSWTFAQLQSIT
jgi:hypothetical protein